MKIHIKFLLIALSLLAAANSTRAASIVWTNTAGGNWSDTNNWNPNQTPGAGDTAVITNAGVYSVLLDVNPAVSGLVLGAAGGAENLSIGTSQAFTLTGTAQINAGGQFNLASGGVLGGNVSLNGVLNCTGGTLSGGLTVNSNSVVNINSGLALNSFTPGSCALTNYGTVNWTGGDIGCNAGPQVYNYGLWNAQTNNTFAGQMNGGFGNGVFNNFGTFLKSAGTNTTTFDGDAIFNGSGTVDVQSGTLDIQRGLESGIINIASGGFFFSGTSLLFSGVTLFSGAGTVTGSVIGTNAVFSGTLNGSAIALSGSVTVASNAVVNFGTSPVSFNAAVLTNYGTVTLDSDLSCDSAPLIYNYGLWDVQTNDSLIGNGSSGGNTTFNNIGTFRKSAGTNLTALNISFIFNNTGTMDVESGTLSIYKGQSGGAASAAVIASGAALAPDVDFIFAGTNTFSGAGNTAGLLTGSNAVFSGVLNCSGTTLLGTMTIVSNSVFNLGASSVSLGSLALTNYGTANWTGGDLICNNSPQVYNYGLWNAQTDNTFEGEINGGSGNGMFNNFGTFLKSAGTNTTTFDGDAIFNGSGTLDVQSGTLDIQRGQDSGAVSIAAGTFISPSSHLIFNGGTAFSGGGIIENLLVGSNAVFSGSLNFSGTTLSGTITLASNAVVNLGTSRIIFDASYAGIGILTNYGTINATTGNFVGDNNPKIYNYGLWDDQADNTFSGQFSSGATAFNNAGTFRKSGTIGVTTIDEFTFFTNSGTMDVQSGTVSFVGVPALTGGTLNFGINSSNSFGHITIGGAVALAGTTSVNLNNLYSPVAGSSFTLLTYSSRSGVFTSLNLPVLPELVWTNNYGATAFTLTVLPAGAPVLSSSLTNGTNFSINWPALAGQNYQLQFTTNLVPVSWTNLGAPLTIPTNGTLSALDPVGTNSQRFYRVILQ